MSDPGFRPVACTLSILAAVAVTAAQGPSAPMWFRVNTPSFDVMGATEPQAVEQTAGALEAFREAFRRLVPDARVDALAPTFVFAFDRFATFEPYAPRYGGQALRVAGSFVGSAQVNYLALTLDEGPGAWSVAYHELTHLIVSQTMIRPPTWFNEGIAEFYSTFVLADNGRIAELGHMMPEHVVLLRREPWLPLEDLFEVEVSSSLYNEGDKRSVFYAESWALVHYLLARPERSAALFDFLGRVSDGQGIPSAFRAAFGMAPSTLETELRRYVEQPNWPIQRYALGAGIGGASSGARRVRDADMHAALGGLQWRLGRQDEAIGLAQLAVDLDPSCAAGWAILAMADVDRFMDVEAVPWLLKAAALPAGDPLTGYLVGTAALRVHERAGEMVLPRADALAIARRALEDAAARMPAYADAWANLAHAALADGRQVEQALDAARRARRLAPTRRHYLLLEAQALMQQDDLGAARRLMEDLLEHDPGTPLADKAAEVIARIDALQEARSRRGGQG